MRCSDHQYIGEFGRTTPGLNDQRDGDVLHCRRECWRRSRLGWGIHCSCRAQRPMGELTNEQLEAWSQQNSPGWRQRAESKW